MQKIFLGIILAFLLNGCIDDKYDLNKEIDIKVSFANDGLTLPASNTQLIALDQIIELNDSGQLIIDKSGNYLFHKVGNNLDSTVVSIGQGSICNAVETIINYHFKEDQKLERTTINERYNTARLSFGIEYWPKYRPDVISQSVRSLEYIKTQLTISFIIYASNIDEFASEISEIQYHVPSYYVLADSSELKETRVKTKGTHEHIIHCKGVDFNAAVASGEKIGYNNKTGEITFVGKMGMSCTINNAHMDEYDALDNPYMYIRATIGTLGTNEVTGRFDKTEKVDVAPIEFDALPDFIRNEEVVIDIDNPMVSITVDNELPAGAMVNASMRSINKGIEVARLDIGEKYNTEPIYFAPSSKQTVIVSRKPIEIPDTVSKNVVIDNMMDLLRIMPDKIEIEGFAHTDSSKIETMALNKDYIVRPSYELIAPLAIGKNMKIVYTKEIDDIHDKLKYISITNMTMLASVTNNIPLDLYAKIIAYDNNGNIIDGITFIQEEKIAANATSNIKIVLQGKAEEFDQLERLTLKIYARSSEALQGTTLNANQALQLKDVKITVK